MLKKEKIIMEEIIGAFQKLNFKYGFLDIEDISAYVNNIYLVNGSKATMGLHYLYHYMEDDVRKFKYGKDEFNARLQLHFDSLIEMNKIEHGTAGSAEDMFMIINFLDKHNDALEIDEVDDYTKKHSKKVMKGAVRMGEFIGMNLEDIADLEIGSLLHDIGKISIPRIILNKPGKLDDYEFKIMKEHPIYGAQILKKSSAMFTENIVSGVYHHHTNFDGSGYPRCEKFKQPPFAQIIRICDSFEAMTSTRKYRDAQNLDFAFSELTKYSGTMYNPDLVKMFLDFNIFNELLAVNKLEITQ